MSLHDAYDAGIDLALRVRASIELRTQRRIRTLQVWPEQDRLVLTGTAPSYHAVQLAIIAGLSALAETPWRIESRIEITPPSIRETCEVQDVACA